MNVLFPVTWQTFSFYCVPGATVCQVLPALTALIVWFLRPLSFTLKGFLELNSKTTWSQSHLGTNLWQPGSSWTIHHFLHVLWICMFLERHSFTLVFCYCSNVHIIFLDFKNSPPYVIILILCIFILLKHSFVFHPNIFGLFCGFSFLSA